jgi:hypothetical protein
MAKRYDGLVAATGNGQWRFMEDTSMRIETEQEATLIIGPPERLIPASDVKRMLQEITALKKTYFLNGHKNIEALVERYGFFLDPA